ncbi:hypothetical protein GGH12_002422 [Coemansia sp. RSA 1822]|nr:hypothetical protein LPJ76_002018 [Coemansia sp. RSA 638]KAJ2119930.1 hypothetical protein IW147_005477 [Coemansia sp. RSA 720]KAJ2540816.1 hypothetical protein GGF49_004167 [Coemansia sp. RSA 1853]KAJ2563726.1 hypothetical protein GGH12_002422 [Coemansia sp. RSA 1822]
MSTPANTSNGVSASLSDADQRKRTQEEMKQKLAKADAIMEPSTESVVDRYLEAGGAPFNTMNLLMSSYEGLAAMTNMVSSDTGPVYGPGINAAISEAVSRKIIENFDPQAADSKYSETGQLPEYIEAMLSHQVWRKTIYRLSERHPGSTMLSAALQHIADKGYQAEMTSLSSAPLHTHVFYSLLAECLENMSPANEENFHEKLEGLITAVCRREQTYLVARYVFHGVQQKLGAKAAGIRRIDDELETYMLDNYKRPQLAINIQLLLSGLVVGGGNSVVDAAASIIQEEYAATGDVASLYNEYHGAMTSGKPAPPVDILRNERVLHPIIEQVFGHLWDTTVQKLRPELANKYIWLIAYAVLCSNEPIDEATKDKLQQLVVQLKEVCEGLSIHPIQTQIYQAVPKILDWISVPILARVVLLWIRDVATYDNFTYYDTYFTSSEVPVLLLLLEEIAYRHPLLKPLVFAAYKDGFESQVPGFSPEKQLRLQKIIINRIALLAQLDYALPVIDYFSAKKEQIDESVMVYFLHRLLAQFEAPYPAEFLAPVLELINYTIDGVKVAKEKEIVYIRGFLASIDNEQARLLCAALPDEASVTATLAD